MAVGARGDDDGSNNAGAISILFMAPDNTVLEKQKISSTEGNGNYLIGSHTTANTNAHRFSFQALSSNGTTGFYANARSSITLIETAQ